MGETRDAGGAVPGHCAARQAANITPVTLLDRMLDPRLRLATSTPRADPAGDYAWAVFARAEALRPGAEAALEAKALKLVGSPDAKPLVPGHGMAVLTDSPRAARFAVFVMSAAGTDDSGALWVWAGRSARRVGRLRALKENRSVLDVECACNWPRAWLPPLRVSAKPSSSADPTVPIWEKSH